jgi:hypothetical protein
MNNLKSSSSLIVLDEEIDRVIFLCSHIAQMASRIRLIHLSNISFSAQNVESSYHSLLSMAENIEGSALLLESLLVIQQPSLMFIGKKKSNRIHYSREELLQLQIRVTFRLSNQIGTLLRDVVERESNDAVETERQSWRDIRTILM